MTALDLEQEIIAYLKVDRQGALVGLTELSKHVGISKSKAYRALSDLAKKGMINIITRHWCPEFHPLILSSLQEEPHVFCEDCDLEYDVTDVLVGIYIQAINID